VCPSEAAALPIVLIFVHLMIAFVMHKLYSPMDSLAIYELLNCTHYSLLK